MVCDAIDEFLRVRRQRASMRADRIRRSGRARRRDSRKALQPGGGTRPSDFHYWTGLKRPGARQWHDVVDTRKPQRTFGSADTGPRECRPRFYRGLVAL